MAATFFRVYESEWEGFNVRFQQKNLSFIIELGVEMIAKAQTVHFGFDSAF